MSVTCLLEPMRLLRSPGVDREEAGGHKVRLFLKWTEWVRSKVGRGQLRGIWLCAPWGLAPSSSCPPTPGLGQPMALPNAARQSQAGAGGSLGRGCWWGGGVLPCLPISLTGRDAFLCLCWLEGAGPSAPSCPMGPTEAACSQAVVPGAEGARLCVGRGRAISPATAHPSP